MSAWLIWLIVAGAFTAGEIATLSLVLVMAAGGAAAGAIAAAAGAPVFAQVLLAIAGTILLLWLVRPVALRHLHPDPAITTGTDALLGRDAVVLTEVTRDGGRVRLNGAEWSARAMDPRQELHAGTVVTVVEIDGATAVVWQDQLGSGMPPEPLL
jgi:membrane protein implicated in regulation of membrane protease activity